MHNNRKLLDEQDTIPLELAENLCANWRAAFSTAFPSVPPMAVLRGFRIPIEDIIELAALGEAVAVRSYLAMDNPNDPSTLKLLLVPIVTDITGQEVDLLTSPQPIQPPQSYIYDFTQPCPIQCDQNSPLYGPVTSGGGDCP